MGRRQDVADCYEKHGHELLRFSISLVGHDDAHDLLADAVTAVLRSRSRRIVDTRAYLYRSLHNGAIKRWRSDGARRARERLSVPPTSYDLPDFDPAIAQALTALSPQQGAVVFLTYWEDLTSAQIAERLGVTVGTVKQHRSRAHYKLSEVLDAHR